MMSEYYDQFHRWEPLAEFHFNLDDNEEMYDDNYVYCLCSRAFIRDGVKTYYVEKDASESDMEVNKEQQMHEWEDHSHVHFSLDTSYKVKCEKDENASCYCSASHTDNYYSTDEHDPAQYHCSSHALQPSDSGADLTYPDYHSDNTNHEKLERMDQDFLTSPNQPQSNEDYLSHDTWEKFWAVNGERLIWASWIKKYSDYINPDFLDENNQLVMDDNNIPKKQNSADQIFNNIDQTKVQEDNDESMRERKFSYDSKVNPYKKQWSSQSSTDKSDKTGGKSNKDDVFVPIGRKRSCSEHDRMLSPRTLAGTDSMTNVTKITLSSYDMSSSHVTSEPSSTDDYSVTSSSSDDPSNDQTRIANIDENIETEKIPTEGPDSEQYWQFLWKKHFGEQYALHYAYYLESQQNKDIPMNVVVPENKEKKEIVEVEAENSEGNSQEMPSVIEMQEKVEEMKIEAHVDVKIDEVDKKINMLDETIIAAPEENKANIAQKENKSDEKVRNKKRNKKTNSAKYLGSVSYILQNFLKDELDKADASSEPVEADDKGASKTDKTETPSQGMVDGTTCMSNVLQSESNSNFSQNSYNEGDDDPPDEKEIKLKRSHEFDEDDESSEKIKSAFEIMGFCLQGDNNMPKGQVVYRKANKRLRPPRSRRFTASRKTYFDDDGNPYQIDQGEDSQEEREMQTDEDCVEEKTNNEQVSEPTNTATEFEDLKANQNNVDNKDSTVLEASNVPFPDAEGSLSDFQDESDTAKPIEGVVGNIVKRRRRIKRYKVHDGVVYPDMPPELADDPKMVKYWKKRHSLFHRFDEGIKLDKESWFSVTPENVALHIANKCTYDVVLDAFCGAGGNTIQFARTCKKVIAIDIDPAKIEMARHNAEVYGVADQIEFIVGDFFELADQVSADMVFLSPPWGGPEYSGNKVYDIETMLEPRPASELMRVARQINTNVALYLPRNTRSDQILAIAKEAGGSVEIEQSYLDRRFVAITAYFFT